MCCRVDNLRATIENSMRIESFVERSSVCGIRSVCNCLSGVSPSLVNEAEAIGPARNVERTPEAASRSGPADRAVTPKISTVWETNTWEQREGKRWDGRRKLAWRRHEREEERHAYVCTPCRRGENVCALSARVVSRLLVVVVVALAHHRGLLRFRGSDLSSTCHTSRKAQYRGWMYWVSRKCISVVKPETGRPLPCVRGKMQRKGEKEK